MRKSESFSYVTGIFAAPRWQNAKKRRMHAVYEGPTGTTITEPMATNAPNTLAATETITETATALIATESTTTAKEAL